MANILPNIPCRGWWKDQTNNLSWNETYSFWFCVVAFIMYREGDRLSSGTGQPANGMHKYRSTFLATPKPAAGFKYDRAEICLENSSCNYFFFSRVSASYQAQNPWWPTLEASKRRWATDTWRPNVILSKWTGYRLWTNWQRKSAANQIWVLSPSHESVIMSTLQ